MLVELLGEGRIAGDVDGEELLGGLLGDDTARKLLAEKFIFCYDLACA